MLVIYTPLLVLLFLGPVAINFLAADLSEKRTNLATVLALIATIGFLATTFLLRPVDGIGIFHYMWVVPIVNSVGIIEMNLRNRMKDADEEKEV